MRHINDINHLTLIFTIYDSFDVDPERHAAASYWSGISSTWYVYFMHYLHLFNVPSKLHLGKIQSIENIKRLNQYAILGNTFSE